MRAKPVSTRATPCSWISVTRPVLPLAIYAAPSTVEPFLADTAAEKPLVIYCYHGNSSQGAADWLSEQGFSDVVSLDGGYEVLRQRFPELLEEMA